MNTRKEHITYINVRVTFLFVFRCGRMHDAAARLMRYPLRSTVARCSQKNQPDNTHIDIHTDISKLSAQFVFNAR